MKKQIIYSVFSACLSLAVLVGLGSCTMSYRSLSAQSAPTNEKEVSESGSNTSLSISFPS